MLAVRIGEKYTVEEWKKFMESEGYQWKDFNPDTIDPEGTKWRNWYYNNHRKLIIAYHLWHIQAPGLVFYKPNPNYIPTPDHPLKGHGKFKAIYLHDTYPMSDVTLVEAEIINVNARIERLDGAPINIDRTTPTRLLTRDPEIYESLKTMREYNLNCFQRWTMLLAELQLSQMQSPMSTEDQTSLRSEANGKKNR